jgi:hypothetical protein
LDGDAAGRCLSVRVAALPRDGEVHRVSVREEPHAATVALMHLVVPYEALGPLFAVVLEHG